MHENSEFPEDGLEGFEPEISPPVAAPSAPLASDASVTPARAARVPPLVASPGLKDQWVLPVAAVCIVLFGLFAFQRREDPDRTVGASLGAKADRIATAPAVQPTSEPHPAPTIAPPSAPREEPARVATSGGRARLTAFSVPARTAFSPSFTPAGNFLLFHAESGRTSALMRAELTASGSPGKVVK